MSRAISGHLAVLKDQGLGAGRCLATSTDNPPNAIVLGVVLAVLFGLRVQTCRC
jgi:hypothetical protein